MVPITIQGYIRDISGNGEHALVAQQCDGKWNGSILWVNDTGCICLLIIFDCNYRCVSSAVGSRKESMGTQRDIQFYLLVYSSELSSAKFRIHRFQLLNTSSLIDGYGLNSANAREMSSM